MKTCPNCKRSIEDDSVYCGYCSAKQPYVPEEEKEEEETGGGAAAEAATAVRRCENCGEQLEQNFDTCWKCGTVTAGDGESPAAGRAEDAAGPVLTVWCLDKRLEVYRDRILTAPAPTPGTTGQAAYVSPCEILIKNIVSIEFTGAEGSIPGCMTVNYTAALPDDTVNVVNMSEYVSFNSGADQEMAKALALVKQCRKDLDAQAGGGHAGR
ncbi:MAG: zinc ribbon domain-containing protein [Elusimicrobiota bacterium]|nr:zinc ribbon domain-containing protein [Elusimicrobiota bacterium]